VSGRPRHAHRASAWGAGAPYAQLARGRGLFALLLVPLIATALAACAPNRRGGEHVAAAARVSLGRDSLAAGWQRSLAESGHFAARACREPGRGWRIEEGRRHERMEVLWTGPRLAVTASGESLAVRQRLELPGDAVWSDVIAAAVAERLAALERAGRPLAEVRFRAFAAAPHDLARITLEWTPGPYVWVTDVAFETDGVTRASFLRRQMAWAGPALFDPQRWERARAALLATGLFARVEGPAWVLDPATHNVAERDTVRAEAHWRLVERKVNRFQGLLGYANREEEEGGAGGRFSGFIDLALGNLFGTGRATRVYWEGLAEDRSRFEFRWHEPFLWRLPLGADFALQHAQEDTLYAETSWEADLVWKPAPAWRVEIGWGRSRLVLGDQETGSLERATTRFALARAAPAAAALNGGWALGGEFRRWDGDGPTLQQATVRCGEWIRRGGWILHLAQEGAIVAGPDSLARSDALLVGGVGSLRGSYEGEYRTVRYALQRVELGPAFDARGGRLYLLADVGWLDRWQPEGRGFYGRRGDSIWRWAIGGGVQVATRSGWLRLEYAVPGGESLWRGRLHFGVTGTF